MERKQAMRHGVEFKINNVTKHTLDDWGMLFAPFDIPSAEVKTDYIELEGADGSLDVTEAFGLNYKDMPFSLKFTLPLCDYNQRLREIKAFLHGKVAKITIYNDTGYYYLGRCQVNDFKANRGRGEVVIDVVAKPYKYKQNETVVTHTITGVKTVIFNNETMKVVPSFECSSDMQLTFNGNTYNVGTSKTRVADIVFIYGQNEITFNGTGTVKVTYQEGSL